MAIPPAPRQFHHSRRLARQPGGAAVVTDLDHVALVTGAARGQGAAIAQRLRADGFAVAAADRHPAELDAWVRDAGGNTLIAIPLDVTSPDQWEAAVAAVAERFG